MCDHSLGALPCLNTQPHTGHGHGCVHHASDAPDRHTDDSTQEEM